MEMARTKQHATFTISPEVLARLETYIAGLEFNPGKSAVVERAVVLFLDEKEKGAKKR